MKADPAQLLPVVYEAATDPQQWPVFLKGLCQQAHIEVASLIVRDEDGKSLRSMESVGADPEAVRLYDAYYGRVDAFFTYADKKGFNRPGVIVPAQAFISESELLKTEFCNDFLLKFGMFHHCLALFGHNGVAHANLSLIRSRKSKPFAKGELRIVRFLAPHVERAIQLGERFHRLQVESEARQSALDQFGLGVVFLDRGGKILGTNDAAAKMLGLNDGIRMRDGRLEAMHSGENAALQTALFQSCQTGAGHPLGSGAALLISRHQPSRPLQVVVGPACASVATLPSCPAAVVFIGDVSARIRPRNELLKALYGLTPAESRLALLLADGKSGEEITALLGITKNTFKTETRSIFTKTGVRRQSQLLRLLMYLPLES